MKRLAKGYVIAVDGPDGVGKTTQVRLLADYLQQRGQRVHLTRHNGGTPIGEELRKASLSKHERSAATDLYISLAMGTALAEDVSQRKQQGEIVVIDRSPLAIVAYQAYGSQLEDKSAAFTACQQLVKAEEIDLLFFLDTSQTIIDKRREQRQANDYFEKKGSAYHQRVQQGYQAGLAFLQKQAKTPKIIVIEANASIDDIHRQMVQMLVF